MNSAFVSFRYRAILLVALLAAPLLHASKESPVIGLSLDSLRDPRWQRDRDVFVHTAELLGAKVLVYGAESNDERQVRDIQSMVERHVDVIVVIPHNASALGAAIKSANDAHIPIISYDRLILNANIDYYLSFDNVKVGELQASYVVSRLPASRTARIVRIHGAPTDNNAKLFKQGQDNILLPLIKAGRIEVVYEDWSADWKAEAAKAIMLTAISRQGLGLDAVIAANDTVAGGAIEAIADKGGAKNGILVTGQDADIAACVRIKSGSQAMTVYKPLSKLAVLAAHVAIDLARGTLPTVTSSIDNGSKAVPSVFEAVTAVDRDNIDATVVADGFHRH
jgi:D-xylose transport system substrate-binding protein